MKNIKTMNYEEKYKQSLEKARELMDKGYDVLMPEIFPELKEKESEDEKIKKAIHIYLDWLDGRKDYEPKGDYSIKDMITWLEKQGKGKSALEAWKDMRFEVYQQASGNRHEPNYSDDSTKMFSLNDIDEIIEKISEQKPDDKVEPKFKVKDWVILDGTVAQILDKQKYGFVGLDINGKDFFCNYGHTDLMRLWTIQDAKDGDVLTNGEFIVIFKQIVEPKYRQHIEAYIGLDLGGNIQITSESWSLGIDKAMPATKEQRDLLFQKMKEAGYEWDSEKKELNKIESKTLNTDKVIEWLKNTIREVCGKYYNTQLVLPYNSTEDLINDFKEDFGL